MNRRLIIRVVICTSLAIGLSAAALSAQRGGGGGGASGGSVLPPIPNRLDILTTAFTLDKAESNQIKTLMDAAHKAAAPIRLGLATSYTALAAAIQAGKPAGDIDTAVKAYATQAAAMADAEVKALAQVLKTLTPAQRDNKAAVDAAFYMFHGIFLNDGKWNIIPDGKTY